MVRKPPAVIVVSTLGVAACIQSVAVQPPSAQRQLGAPIVTYWAGPALTDATARQMAAAGFNLVWCTEQQLDVAQRHRLRAQLTDPLLSPESLDDPAKRRQLDALIARVRRRPALYDYFITDEPNARRFAALGGLVAHLRERDPAHLAYVNLFPTYASNAQLGTRGDRVTAYREYLRRFLQTVHPALLSYDHYQFTTHGDTPDYFLNLALVRQAAQRAGIPFLNIVQACTWTRSMRVPGPDEERYLVYTTLAYGAQGISYFVYQESGNLEGGMVAPDGTPTPLYHAVARFNREFAAIAAQLQSLRSVAVYHAGTRPPGAEPLPRECGFQLEPPLTAADFTPGRPVKGALLGCFGPADPRDGTPAVTDVLVVNLDYRSALTTTLWGPGQLARFEPTDGKWARLPDRRVELHLPPGGGILVRLATGQTERNKRYRIQELGH